jgi:hypothetical protein
MGQLHSTFVQPHRGASRRALQHARARKRVLKRDHRHRHLRGVALQLAFERQILKPVFA